MKLIRDLIRKLIYKYKRGPVRNLRDPTEDMFNVGYTTNKILFKRKRKERPNPKF
jgi:hypothetical protein